MRAVVLYRGSTVCAARCGVISRYTVCALWCYIEVHSVRAVIFFSYEDTLVCVHHLLFNIIGSPVDDEQHN